MAKCFLIALHKSSPWSVFRGVGMKILKRNERSWWMYFFSPFERLILSLLDQAANILELFWLNHGIVSLCHSTNQTYFHFLWQKHPRAVAPFEGKLFSTPFPFLQQQPHHSGRIKHTPVLYIMRYRLQTDGGQTYKKKPIIWKIKKKKNTQFLYHHFCCNYKWYLCEDFKWALFAKLKFALNFFWKYARMPRRAVKKQMNLDEENWSGIILLTQEFPLREGNAVTSTQPCTPRCPRYMHCWKSTSPPLGHWSSHSACQTKAMQPWCLCLCEDCSSINWEQLNILPS